MDNIKPLNVEVSRAVLNGHMYDLMSYEEYAKIGQYIPNTALYETVHGQGVVIPNRGNYNGQTGPGLYNAGCIDFVILPDEKSVADYIPTKIVNLDNHLDIRDILQRKDVMARMDEPWITSPDNITQFNIGEEDQPEMRCLKTALNMKRMDIDKYAPRFGDNYPNDKRQLKNKAATLHIIKRYCKCCDMEALITLRDKNPDVPNPMGSEVTFSLTADYLDDDE